MKKRADGYYQKKIIVNGKPKIVYAKSTKELKQKCDDLLNKSKNTTLNIDLSVSYWIDLWFSQHKKGISPNTIDSYIKPVKDCKDYFSNKRINDLVPIDINNFINSLVDKDFSRQTINLRYIVMCKTLDYAIINSIITINVARAVSLPRNLKKLYENLCLTTKLNLLRTQKTYSHVLFYTLV